MYHENSHLVKMPSLRIRLASITQRDVRNLGKFSTNLIQKIINIMFVTSDMCTCDLSATNKILIMILIIENKRWVATVAYPAAPEPLLVDIAFVDVVIPLNAMQ